MFLFTGAARMMRPVVNLAMDKIELIGTFEQVYMDIAITAKEIYKGKIVFYLYPHTNNYDSYYLGNISGQTKTVF